MFQWDVVAKLGLWLLIGAGVLWAVYKGVRFLQRTGENKVILAEQNKVIENAKVRTRIEQETKHRTPEEIARDIGADGTGGLR